MFNKTGVLKNLIKMIEKHMFLSLIFLKIAVWGLQYYQKRDTAEICKVFENTSFKEHFWVTASIIIA